MANQVAEEKKRIRKPYMLSPEAIEYIDLKAPLFARGNRGGASQALEAMILFARDYEKEMNKDG